MAAAGKLRIKYGAETLSSYDVELATDAGKLSCSCPWSPNVSVTSRSLYYLSGGKGRESPGHKEKRNRKTPRKQGFPELPDLDSNQD